MAKPFPSRGYIMQAKRAADIGRRSSTLDAERATLRMMARMMRWTPREDLYEVRWTTLDGKGVLQPGWAWFGLEEEQILRSPDEPPQKPTFMVTGMRPYYPVTRRIIKKVAHYNGSFRDLTRYGAVDQSNEIHIDLGFRSSYDAGGRAALRVLGRRLKGPFSAAYWITWRYYSPDKMANEANINYNPSLEDHLLLGDGYSLAPKTNYDASQQEPLQLWDQQFSSITNRAIIQVGRRSGTFSDLTKFGARDDLARLRKQTLKAR